MTTFPISYETAVIAVCIALCVPAVIAAVRSRLGWATGAVMSALSLCLCLLGARLFYILVCDLTGAGYWGPFLAREPYFYAFGGGVLGFLAALALTAAVTKKPFASVSDAFVPVGLIAIAALRLTEALSDFGWGDLVEAAWLQGYPFAIQNMYEEWCAAVFNLEALCALGVLAGILIARDRLRARRLPTAIVWWALTQIFCESLRVESIQWGFVRVQQLLSAVLTAAVMLWGTLQLPRAQRKRSIPSWIGFAAGVGAVIFLEYAMDKMPWPKFIDYIAMALVLAGMGWCAQRLIPGKQEAL